jgi:hypothetical protein
MDISLVLLLAKESLIRLSFAVWWSDDDGNGLGTKIHFYICDFKK